MASETIKRRKLTYIALEPPITPTTPTTPTSTLTHNTAGISLVPNCVLLPLIIPLATVATEMEAPMNEDSYDEAHPVAGGDQLE